MMNERLYFSDPLLQKWNAPFFEEKGLSVHVLRLDSIHPIVGGNKWMKLRHFLQKAIDEKKKGILTKGGPWSNHIHASAWICKQLGLPIHIWVKGSEKMQTAVLADVKDWGAEVRFINRDLFYDEVAAQAFATEYNLHYIPMGGADVVGIEASCKYLQALHLPHFNYAVCAVGTATTFGGLAFVQDNFETVLGMDAGTKDDNLQLLINEWQQQLPQKKLVLNTDYSFGGFARRTPELVHFANDFFSITGIPTDVVYTAKLMYAVRDLALKNYFPVGSSIMVLHSGGLQGNRSVPTGLLQF